MTDAQFYKSFMFNLFQHRKPYSADMVHASGCPCHYLAHMVRGTGKICTATETLHLKEGDVFYIPRGLKYRSFWIPDAQEPVVFYSFGFLCFPLPEETVYKLQKIECTPPQSTFLAQLEADIAVGLRSIGLLYRFLGEVGPMMAHESEWGNEVIVTKALEFMRQNIHCNVGDIARHCGISESGLYAKFRKHLDQTPVEASHRILTEKATELLCTTDLTVEEISSRLGFSSSSYFRKIFRVQTGTTPLAYRRQNNRL